MPTAPLGRAAASWTTRSATPSCGLERHRAGRCRTATLPELFAAQAARTPDAVAVVFEEQHAELRRARRPCQPAGASSARAGVGPETMVALCVERSPEMVIGLLGILKAGGAYLPLDPNYPRERLAFMLADAGARCW